MEKICFFIGHHDPPEILRPALEQAVERHITEYGVTCFLVGNYGRFDRMARSAVLSAKTRHPGVTLYLALAYLPEPGKPPDSEGCDGVYFPEGQETIPRRVAIPHLNQRTVDEADYIIAYVAHISGGAYKTLDYAKCRARRGLLHITNLADAKEVEKCVST